MKNYKLFLLNNINYSIATILDLQCSIKSIQFAVFIVLMFYFIKNTNNLNKTKNSLVELLMSYSLCYILLHYVILFSLRFLPLKRCSREIICL